MSTSKEQALSLVEIFVKLDVRDSTDLHVDHVAWSEENGCVDIHFEEQTLANEGPEALAPYKRLMDLWQKNISVSATSPEIYSKAPKRLTMRIPCDSAHFVNASKSLDPDRVANLARRQIARHLDDDDIERLGLEKLG